MAQLVERTLGKGEVPSSTLGISTTLKKPRFGGVFVLDHPRLASSWDGYLIGAAQGLIVAKHRLMIQITS